MTVQTRTVTDVLFSVCQCLSTDSSTSELCSFPRGLIIEYNQSATIKTLFVFYQHNEATF